jgi:UDP-galactopyranose mutase
MNYIIGSGLVAFIAKHLFPDYQIIPVGKSRFYQFEVSTCDDYVFCHPEIDDFMKEMAAKTNTQTIPVLFKRALSYCGQIIYNKNEGFMESWINKVYDDAPHIQAIKLTKFDSFVYNTSCTDIFKILEKDYKQCFRQFIESGNKLLSIDTENKTIITKNGPLEYDNIINTIPLDVMFKMCNIEDKFKALDLHTFVLETEDLDFEGASELLVVDENIDFYKSTRIGKKVYQFYSTKDITNITQYLNLMIEKFNLLSGTVVRDAIPCGDHKKHKDLEKYNICSVGSCAQWDDMMDLSSCILKLIRHRNK